MTDRDPSENRLSIPELEARIVGLEAELRARRQEQNGKDTGLNICTRCGKLYGHFAGCGCAILTYWIPKVAELEARLAK
jgi:hypothetical protein